MPGHTMPHSPRSRTARRGRAGGAKGGRKNTSPRGAAQPPCSPPMVHTGAPTPQQRVAHGRAVAAPAAHTRLRAARAPRKCTRRGTKRLAQPRARRCRDGARTVGAEQCAWCLCALAGRCGCRGAPCDLLCAPLTPARRRLRRPRGTSALGACVLPCCFVCASVRTVPHRARRRRARAFRVCRFSHSPAPRAQEQHRCRPGTDAAQLYGLMSNASAACITICAVFWPLPFCLVRSPASRCGIFCSTTAAFVR